jgi:hypothetical protein
MKTLMEAQVLIEDGLGRECDVMGEGLEKKYLAR